MSTREINELPYTEALEAQLKAARFMTRLAFNEDIGKLCLALFLEPSRKEIPPSAFDELFAGTVTRRAWTHLASGLLRTAIPHAWDTDAARFAEEASHRLSAEEALSNAALPTSSAWWWFGEPGALSNQETLAALAWESDGTGLELYPFLFVDGRWGKGFDNEGETYRLGPMAIGGFRIDYGVSLRELERQWASDFPDFVQAMMSRYVRFSMAGCSAIARGELVAHTGPVERHERKRLLREFKIQSVSSQVQSSSCRA